MVRIVECDGGWIIAIVSPFVKHDPAVKLVSKIPNIDSVLLDQAYTLPINTQILRTALKK